MLSHRNRFIINIPLLLFVCLSILQSFLSFHSITTVNCQSYNVTNTFTQAIDAALIEITEVDEYREGYLKLNLIFPIPECLERNNLQSYPYPPTLSFTKNKFKMCYEQSPGTPWEDLHLLVSKTLVTVLKRRYASELKNVEFIVEKMDTSKSGYFNTLKEAVDSGMCDVCVASTNIDSNRDSKVHFQCPYASSSPGWLYNPDLNPSLNVKSFYDLNQTGIKIGVFGGSYYENFITTLSAAQFVKVNTGYPEVYTKLANREIHAMLADATDLFTWVKENKANCTKCITKGFGDPFEMASFTTRNIMVISAGTGNCGLFNGCLEVVVKRLPLKRLHTNL
ncbi:hypothetical protein ABK040_003223 [Willaertia magna]